MSDEPPMTFLFSSQIEEGIVSILWHEPERLAAFWRDLDPSVHFTTPALRHILEAITLVYRETGSPEWLFVVQTIKELGHFDEVGGLDGLDDIYSLKRFRADKETTDAIFAEYVRLLQAYAEHRKQDPPTLPYRFARGEILLRENKSKAANHPDYLGTGKIAGKLYQASGRRSQEGILVSLFPK